MDEDTNRKNMLGTVSPYEDDTYILVGNIPVQPEPLLESDAVPMLEEEDALEEQRELIVELNMFGRRSFLFSFQDHGEMKNVKSEKFVSDMKSKFDEEGIRKINYMTIAVKDQRVDMAINVETPPKGHAVPIGDMLEVILLLFPGFRGQISCDTDDNGKYLPKARKIICPLNPIDIDLDPYIYGEKPLHEDEEVLYTLLRRIQNTAKVSKARRPIARMITDEMWKAAEKSVGSFATYVTALVSGGTFANHVESPEYRNNWEKHVFSIRLAFDQFGSECVVPDQVYFTSETFQTLLHVKTKKGVVHGEPGYSELTGCTEDEYDKLQAKRIEDNDNLLHMNGRIKVVTTPGMTCAGFARAYDRAELALHNSSGSILARGVRDDTKFRSKWSGRELG